ncbi:MAG: flagellin [Firmicutes bacterium HGW-Firmicutes-15]|nr:MAG: flagellin [Firmicutes bacterium HGW-Firmicutes-15]
MIINHNIPALNTYNKLVMNTKGMSAALEKLSSGLRINKAADDAAGLAISEKMRSQIRGLDQASRNAQDGISMIQTAEGGLNETHSILQRMRELAVQSANGTYTSQDRMQIQKEVDQLTSEIDRIAGTTQFNGKNLLDGTSSALTSTDQISTRVFMRDGLRQLDQFGQKAAGGGNYELKITATPGDTEVQKTDIMRIKHQTVTVTGGTTAGTTNAGYYDLSAANASGLSITLANGFVGPEGAIAGLPILLTGFAINFTGASAADGGFSVNAVASGGSVSIVVTLEYGASGTANSGVCITTNQQVFDAVMALKISSTGSANWTGLNVNYFLDMKIDDAGAKLTGAGTTGVFTRSSGGTATSGFTATKIERVGEIALDTTKLYDIQEFWDSSGNFILQNPQTLNMVQGDGQKTYITLFDTDTIGSVKDKLNDAIYNGLGQKLVVDSTVSMDRFVSYDPWGTDGLQAVPGTFIIRSGISGNDGKITFIGDDPTLRALSLQTIQKATETQFKVSVYEAHKQTLMAKDVEISGNNLIGVVNKDVDVQFASNTGVKVTWDDTLKKFALAGDAANPVSTFIHISDNTTVFHIGANQKQDIGVGIGDMGARALGVNNILVNSNELSNIAIGKIDKAIFTVSAERAKLGAVQNRLDHTINNLSVTSENLTASESRIRDVDMAKEMMNFTKFNILNQAATAMLAQANQMPQTVLQLLR